MAISKLLTDRSCLPAAEHEAKLSSRKSNESRTSTSAPESRICSNDVQGSVCAATSKSVRFVKILAIDSRNNRLTHKIKTLAPLPILLPPLTCWAAVYEC